MRFMRTEPTMPRQPTKPTESPGLKFMVPSVLSGWRVWTNSVQKNLIFGTARYRHVRESYRRSSRWNEKYMGFFMPDSSSR